MKKGFTLLELLIVIMVIGILIGIALPRFKGMQDEGNIAKAKGELRTLQLAVESYYIHNSNAYPLVATTATWQTALVNDSPRVLGAALTDPFNGTTKYQYKLDTNSAYYVIWSVGAGATGSVTSISTAGVVVDTADCIFVSNGDQDTAP